MQFLQLFEKPKRLRHVARTLGNQLALALIEPHRAADLLARVGAQMIQIGLAGCADGIDILTRQDGFCSSRMQRIPVSAKLMS